MIQVRRNARRPIFSCSNLSPSRGLAYKLHENLAGIMDSGINETDGRNSDGHPWYFRHAVSNDERIAESGRKSIDGHLDRFEQTRKAGYTRREESSKTNRPDARFKAMNRSCFEPFSGNYLRDIKSYTFVFPANKRAILVTV